MNDLPQRKNIRLTGYDYSQNGAYFVTVCVKDKHELLGKMENIAPDLVGAIINRPQICLSACGTIVVKAIENISKYYPQILVDKHIVMPNHIHLILFIGLNHGRLLIAPTSISVAIQQFKRYITKQIAYSIWQRSYYDRIIRNDVEYQNIWRYIDESPDKWSEDEYYCKIVKGNCS